MMLLQRLLLCDKPESNFNNRREKLENRKTPARNESKSERERE